MERLGNLSFLQMSGKSCEWVEQAEFQGLRWAKKRSLLGVNEHFEPEYNAEITLLYPFNFGAMKNLYYLYKDFRSLLLRVVRL